MKKLNLRQSRLTKTTDAPSWLQSKAANEREEKTILKSKAE